MFFVEFIAGWLAESSGLIADSLDMLADTLVYAVSLYAVGKAIKYKANAAIFNGTLQTLLALLVLLFLLIVSFRNFLGSVLFFFWFY